jgi:hypothetical protein
MFLNKQFSIKGNRAALYEDKRASETMAKDTKIL